MKHKKIYAALIAVALMLSILPFGAFAATNYDLYIGGAQFTSSALTITRSNLSSGVTSGSATYDPSTNTLTLDNITVKNAVKEYSIQMDDMDIPLTVYSAITYNGTAPLTIVLKGTNTIVAKGATILTPLVLFNNAVRAELASVTIKSADGKGTLVADGSNAHTAIGFGYGLYVGSTLTIENCTVEAFGPLTEKSGLNPLASYGISAGNGIVIKNSKVTATGGRAVKSNDSLLGGLVSDEDLQTMSFGMFCEERGVDVIDSTVTAKSGLGTLSAAIVSADAVNVKNSTLKASGVNGATMAFGVMSNGAVSIDNSNVEATASDTTNAEDAISCGIISIGDLSIKNGSNVKAAAGKSVASIGLCAGDDELGVAVGTISIADSEVTATGDTVAVNVKPVTKNFTTDYTVSVSEKADGADVIKWKKEFDNVQDKILEFKYYKAEPGIIDINCPSAKFTDVPKNIWYHEYVDYAIERGCMVGTSDDTFEPNTSMTRAMFTMLLNNMEGNPEPEGGSCFTDVPDSAWYAPAVNWAYEQGLVSGVGEGLFNPNAKIKRQEMAILIYNYAVWKKLDVSASAKLDSFKDANKVSSWALTELQWAYATGIISGLDDGTIDPLGTATRAQIATVITEFMRVYDL